MVSNKAEIFISHIHEEAIAAKGLNDYLSSFDLKTFLSSESWQIKLGDRWFDRITSELEAAKIVILMLSPRSVNRPWINFEAGWAWAQKKLTIPACFGGLDVGSMPRPYSDLQGVQLDTGYFGLVWECREYLGLGFPPLRGPDDIPTIDLLTALKGKEPPLRPIPLPVDNSH